jgi:hypothetical protein
LIVFATALFAAAAVAAGLVYDRRLAFRVLDFDREGRSGCSARDRLIAVCFSPVAASIRSNLFPLP